MKRDSESGNAIDLLSQVPISPITPGMQETTEIPKKQAACVRLLHSVRVPANHSRIVEARVEGETASGQSYFESAFEELAKDGLIIEDGVVETSPKGII